MGPETKSPDTPAGVRGRHIITIGLAFSLMNKNAKA